MLACAAYQEQVRSDIRTEAGGAVRIEHAERAGTLVLRAAQGKGGLLIEAWYDSLSIWREGPEGRITPDAEGLLGGRWRGTLTPDGGYSRGAVPFIPDGVAEIADLSGVIDDFLPRLPASALADGARHTWSRRSVSDSTAVIQDSVEAPLHREIEEKGSLVWDGRLGPTGWERTLTLRARLEPKGARRPGIRSVVTQKIEVKRLPCLPAR